MYKKYIDICILPTVVHESSLVSSCVRQGGGNICCCVQTVDQVACESLLECCLQQPLFCFSCVVSPRAAAGCRASLQSLYLSVTAFLLDKRFSSASFSLVVYVKNLRWFTRVPPPPSLRSPRKWLKRQPIAFPPNLPNTEPLGTVCGSVLFTENAHYVRGKKKQTRNSRICIYSINAPHQNYNLYVVFFMFPFFMLCLRYVYMQTHVLLKSKNKDDEW